MIHFCKPISFRESPIRMYSTDIYTTRKDSKTLRDWLDTSLTGEFVCYENDMFMDGFRNRSLEDLGMEVIFSLMMQKDSDAILVKLTWR